ncbi:hypothetical protein J5N97_024618 [Dioscorea zingiberensis]|uniref:VQ domain-containing protein n=1 Tax=Dioscorea zingiberensis TaxID=325984 RepID=A0A9D5C721_9LILI|nr:hypothetical protein J5N97_024618 [Dioscorea zingiberensis]
MDSSYPHGSFQLTPPPPATEPPYLAAIHAVRKPPSKPWRRPEPPPARVYRVEPRGFRRLVQRLTGAPPPQAATRPLKETAPPPPPLDLAPRSRGSEQLSGDASFSGMKPVMTPKHAGGLQLPAVGGQIGFFSPTFYSGWCLSPLFSPGTMAALDHSSSTVL